MSDLPDKPKSLEIRQINADSSLPKGYDLLDLGPVNGIQRPKVLRLDGGFVAHFEVPAGWRKQQNFERSYSGCYLESNNDVELRIGEFGIPLAAAHCSQIKKLFFSPDQILSSADIASLQQALSYGALRRLLLKAREYTI
jgi:hypothetical protein